LPSLTASRNNVLLQKQIVAQQLADQTSADEKAKGAMVDANEANVRQLEAMQSFKTLAAPFDGVVTARNVEIGMLINSGGSGQPLFEVSDLHRVRIYVQVPQSFTAGLAPGMKATFEMPQYPGVQFDAMLSHISKAINSNSHSMQVELQADNATGKFFGGSYCNVHFEFPVDPNLVKIPSTALVTGNQGTQVATLDGNDKVVLKNVQLGRDFGDSVEVVAGLSPSDRIINSPPETLAAGDAVRVAATTPQTAAAPRRRRPRSSEGAAMEIYATLPLRSRDLRLDLIRGLANWAIFLDHIPHEVLSSLTTRNYGFSDAADLFVFISGYTVATVFGRIMIERGRCCGCVQVGQACCQEFMHRGHLEMLWSAARLTDQIWPVCGECTFRFPVRIALRGG